MINSSKGFSLVEVMVASLILFSVTGAAVLTLKNSSLSMGKIRATSEIAESASFIKEAVDEKMDKGDYSGTGSFGKNITYKFTSRKIDEKLSFKGFSYFLYGVDLKIMHNDSRTLNVRNYSYNKLITKKSSSIKDFM